MQIIAAADQAPEFIPPAVIYNSLFQLRQFSFYNLLLPVQVYVLVYQFDAGFLDVAGRRQLGDLNKMLAKGASRLVVAPRAKRVLPRREIVPALYLHYELNRLFLQLFKILGGPAR